MLGAFIVALSVSFHGIMGQSARPDEKPLSFTGVTCLTDGPDGRVFFGGDDGLLYEVKAGRPIGTGVRMQGSALHWDGRVLRALGGDDVWEVDPMTFRFRNVVKAQNRRFDLAAIIPSDPSHPFARYGRYITYDAGRDALVALDDAGRETGVPFPLAARKKKSILCGLGFLPCGDLVAVSYYPDLRLYRYRADGTQMTGCGWPVNRGFGYFRTSGGETYHAGTARLVRLSDNMAGARDNVLQAGAEGSLRGYARQGTREFLATSQGLYFRDAGEETFRRRFGGIRPLSALAVNGKFVYMSMGGCVRRMYLDEDETGTFNLSDESYLRVNGEWTLRPLDFRPDGENLRVAAGAGGEWLFAAIPPPGNNTVRRFWTCLSKIPCERVAEPLPDELVRLVRAANVPGGIVPGKMAREGKWLIVEDRRNFRLLRFKIK